VSDIAIGRLVHKKQYIFVSKNALAFAKSASEIGRVNEHLWFVYTMAKIAQS
jgi:hypothetical protein